MKVTTGEKAIDAAMKAGFEIASHGVSRGTYLHVLRDAAGREIYLRTELGTGRLVKANADATRFEVGDLYWSWVGGAAARSIPAFAKLLARVAL